MLNYDSDLLCFSPVFQVLFREQQEMCTWTSCLKYLTKMVRSSLPSTSVWDRDPTLDPGDGSIDFKEFMIATDMSSSGDPEEKLR